MKRSLLPLIAVFALLAACKPVGEKTSNQASAPASVSVVKVEAASIPRLQVLAGTVRPADRAWVSSRVMGAITRLNAGLGTQVQAGDFLAEIDAGEIGARLRAAHAQLSQVDRELARERSLLEKGASSADSVRLFEDRRRAAQATVEEAETMASYTRITAPFAGVITRRQVEVGDLATPGAPLIEIEGTQRFRVELAVPESFAMPALGATLLVDSDRGSSPGILSEFSPAADAATRTRQAKIELSAGADVRSGEFVRVRWPDGQTNTLVVPTTAVVRNGQMEQVFAVEGDSARLRLIKTGGVQDQVTLILSGLDAGETVINNPPATLRDGQRLELRR